MYPRGKLLSTSTANIRRSISADGLIALYTDFRRSAIISPKATSCFGSHISSIPDMSLPPSASFLLLYNSALQDYTTQTGTNLIDHPFAKQLEKCESVDTISSLLQENVRRFCEFRREDGKITKSLKCAVHVLYTLSTSTVLGEGVGLVRTKAAISISYPQCIFHSHSHPQRPCLLHLQSYSR
jgi:hypothetical protein